MNHRYFNIPLVSAIALLSLSACQAERQPPADPPATQAAAPDSAAMGDDGGHDAAEMHDAMSEQDRKMGADGRMTHGDMPMGKSDPNAGNMQPAPSPTPSGSSMPMNDDM